MSGTDLHDSLEYQAALRRFNHQDNVDKCLEHLLGICTGLTADSHVSDEEIVFLHHWLMDHPILENIWPASEMLALTTRILDDNVIDDSERQQVSVLLNKVIGSPIENGVASGMSTESPLDEDALVIVPDHTFIFTGKFAFGSRKKCEETVKNRGGKVGGKDITLRTNYLVIGGTASEHWKFSNFGRKIQKAINIRDDERSRLKIISEQQWLEAINNTQQLHSTPQESHSHLIDADTEVIIPERNFVITGEIRGCSRANAIEFIECFGGKVTKGVSLRTDYLVFGGEAPKNWKVEELGSKARKALEMRQDERSNIKIVSDIQLRKAVEHMAKLVEEMQE